MNIELWLDNYCRSKLFSEPAIGRYAEQSSVVTVELDEGIVFDLMVLVSDDVFEREFVGKFGKCFVLNDQECKPPVFTRFKSYAWLRSDFERRLAISLWIFGKSVVIRDPEDTFGSIVREHVSVFERNLGEIIKRKYVEFRSDRHNLRQTVHHGDWLACEILKANIIKLAAELQILSQGKPYPYKKWLAHEVRKSDEGTCLLDISRRFIEAKDPAGIIATSEELVQTVVSNLGRGGLLPSDVLSEWWLHLG